MNLIDYVAATTSKIGPQGQGAIEATSPAECTDIVEPGTLH